MIDEYKVYVKVDEKSRITAMNSDAFLSSLDGWQEIDSGIGDKYHHAQGNYLPKAIMDDYGVYRYKLMDGVVMERTQVEIDADRNKMADQLTEIDKERSRKEKMESEAMAAQQAYQEGVQEA